MESHPRDRRSPQLPRHPGYASAQPPSVESAVSAPRSGNPQAALETPPLAPAERHYLNEGELASRWGLSPKTLQRWRVQGTGPLFAKFSKKVSYPLEGPGGVLDWEERILYCSTSERAFVSGRRS